MWDWPSKKNVKNDVAQRLQTQKILEGLEIQLVAFFF